LYFLPFFLIISWFSPDTHAEAASFDLFPKSGSKYKLFSDSNPDPEQNQAKHGGSIATSKRRIREPGAIKKTIS
jgi:hypothetical protein